MKQFHLSKLIIFIAILSGWQLTVNAQVSTFIYTGAVQSYTVPAGVTSIGVDAIGGCGGDPYYSFFSPPTPITLGGRIQCTLNVTPLQVLYVYVGGKGNNWQGPSGQPGGFNGGGNGGSYAAPGGGASDIRTISGTSNTALSSRMVVAGGGGGGGDFGEVGGPGGGPIGGSGVGGASGGTQTGGGGGGSSTGTFGQGATPAIFNSAGGGGGGWWGGAAGAGDGGGGGGSSYPATAIPPVVAITHTQGYSGANGNGQVIITVLCNNPGTVTGAAAACLGTTTNFTTTGIAGGIWSSSNTAVATVSATGVVSGVSAGAVNITYTVPNICGGSNPAFAPITINPVPSAITGTATACIGSSSTLSSGPAGGLWTSGNTSVATIDPSTGTFTGVTVGNATISFTLSTGCAPATRVITINPAPAAISGTLTVCGTLTTLLNDLTTGGTWTSNNSTLASVSSSGLVTGGSTVSGNPIISYTLPTGCSSSATLTVNSLSPISGIPSMCNGFSTTLLDASPGGTWSSSNTSVATVGSSSGLVTSASIGTTNVTYTIAATGCATSISVAVTGVPTISSVSGGGSYCSGGTGVTVGLTGSGAGVSYQLFNGSSPVGSPVLGSGLSINFGLQTAAGTYGVIADPFTGCATPQSGSATVTITPLPAPFTLSATGGGAYCAGGTGQHILLSSSVIGTNYQLFGPGGVPVGSVMLGTSGPLDFGLVTTAGAYSVTATNTITGCIGQMSNTVTITINPLPALNTVTVTNSGAFCFGTSSNVHVGLSGSVTGTTYQLFYGGAPLGAPVAGATGSTIDFGIESTPGTYTVVATTAAGCSAAMSGSASVVVNSLPTLFTVTGGGTYCTGPATVHVGLNGSTIGVNYQLYSSGVITGAPKAGTGSSLDFGALPAGSYTISATNGTTGCALNMTGSASITVNPLPTPFIVGGGGGYCSGSAGPHVTLSGSNVGTTYSLLFGATIVGSLSGTGSSLDFGSQTLSGSPYTVTATSIITGCTGPMTGSATVTLNLLPVSTYSVTVTGGGSYCAGGTGRSVGLSGSTSGISYQIYIGGVATGTTFTGTGSSFTYPTLQTTTGSYTIVGTNTSTTCTAPMTGSITISTTPLPTIYSVTGGGGYCAGTALGVHIGLAASDVGVNYQLKKGATSVGSPLSGIGGAIDFGTDTAGSYTVVATNATTGCTSTMFGTAVSSINPLPTAYDISASGSFCLGSGGYPVTLSNSDLGINYQLLNGGVPVGGPIAGTGAPLNFGNQAAAGNYTIVATNASTGCTKNMTGTATVSITTLPIVYNITSVGTSYCTGGTGVQIGLNASTVGVNYQLYNGVAVVPGANLTGTGAALNFGLQTAGVYTVVANNPSSTCSNVMAGTITVTTNPLPALYTISGGGSYCFGGTGVPVSLSSSTPGIIYQLSTGGVSAGVPLTGTGSALNFGAQTTGGGYIITATNPSTGCSSAMIGTATVSVNPLPVQHTVTGGGNYCPGSAGVDIAIDGSNTGISYQLYNGAVAVAAMPGTGAAIDFGFQAATGTYTIVATNTGTTCTAPMTGSATVALYPLPALFSVTGGGSYCPGTGVHVGLSGSAVGVTYQLYDGAGIITSLIGTGLPLDFGLMTDPGTYTVAGISAATSCSRTMSGSVSVMVNTLPTTFNVTGGGNYCTGGAGLHVGLDGSQPGTSYQLMNGIVAIGAPLAGTGFALDFGAQTAAGTYTIVATSGATGCNNTMTGSVAIIVNTLPVVHTVSGGGVYCAGTGGVSVGLLASDAGINYQLVNGITSVGLPMAGTGSALDFGAQIAAGTYTIVATNNTTSCSSNMFGNAVITINPLPTAYTVTGGGNYCPGGAGVHVGLTNSAMGINYQLFNGMTPVGAPVAGTGSPIDFGLQTAAGIYTIAGTSFSTSCVNTMAGSVTIGISTLPAVYTVTSSASQYCAGGEGVTLILSGSDAGTNYQLRVGGVPAGSAVAGTGLELSFGLQTAAGNYTIVATNASGCSSNMASSATIVINPLPTTYSVVGGGNFCPGGIGVHVGIAGSHTGISYQLFVDGATPVGSPVFGTGFALDFGLQTAAGVYTVVAANPATTCVNNMAGSATVGISTLPLGYTVTGGGNYCAGGTGVNIGLSGSNTGVTYQLYNGGSLIGSAISGTGLALNFGSQALAGSYTVVAMGTVTGCSSNMAGSVPVTINSLPTAYAVSGGGNICPGSSGVHVGLLSSATGINYQLFNGTLAVGAAVPGTGVALDFGPQAIAGNYTVVATNTTTTCTNNMSGGAAIILNTPPVAFTVIGGGNYCAGGTGVSVGLNSSATGVSYQLYNGGPVGFSASGTGGPIDFGLQTATGTYSVVASNIVTGCTSNMAGTTVITVSPLVTPAILLAATGGDTICSGTAVTISASVVNGGSAPVYSWNVNGSPVVAAGASYTYTPAVGDIVNLSLTSNAACATPAIVNSSLPLTVQTHGMPDISIVSGNNPVCIGTSVTFTAATDFGGSAPTISWMVNGVTQTTAPGFIYMPANNDAVSAVLTSNYHCRLATNATSNSIIMNVDVPVTPSVSILANPGTHVKQGQVVLLTATVSNDVVSPAYQWLLNGVPISGANGSSYTATNFADMDSFTCVVVSGGGCSALTGLSSVVLHVGTNVGVTQVNAAGSDIKLIPNPNNGAFTIKGTIGTTNDEEVSVEVSNMLGQVIYKDNIMAHGGNIDQKVQINNIANGMYLLNLHSASANNVFHVVIEQ